MAHSGRHRSPRREGRAGFRGTVTCLQSQDRKAKAQGRDTGTVGEGEHRPPSPSQARDKEQLLGVPVREQRPQVHAHGMQSSATDAGSSPAVVSVHSETLGRAREGARVEGSRAV